MTAPHFTATVWERSKDKQCFVSVPQRNRHYNLFTPGKPVILTLADDPDVQMKSYVRSAGGSGRRSAKIMRRKQSALADQFAEGVEVRVELTEEVKT